MSTQIICKLICVYVSISILHNIYNNGLLIIRNSYKQLNQKRDNVLPLYKVVFRAGQYKLRECPIHASADLGIGCDSPQ